jgi:hypothetical protein
LLTAVVRGAAVVAVVAGPGAVALALAVGVNTHDPPCEQLLAGVATGAVSSVVVVRCWGVGGALRRPWCRWHPYSTRETKTLTTQKELTKTLTNQKEILLWIRKHDQKIKLSDLISESLSDN